MIILYILIPVLVLYLLAIKGRRNHPDWDKLSGWKYAHRGLHDKEKPENSMAAFRAALENGYGIELDIHLLRDGNLAVLHDSSLKRMTGLDLQIEDLTTEDLAGIRLNETEETIPLFRDVLDLYQGRVPMIVELKVANGNHAALCEAACKMLNTYDGPYCLESFDPRCIIWLRKHHPELMRGQLSSNHFKGESTLPWIAQFVATNMLTNLISRPDFIAYHYGTRKTLTNWLCRKLWRIKGVSWTLGTQEEYDTAVKEGWIPIFENFKP